MDPRQEMLGEFREELSTTRRILERVPEHKLGWQPHPKSMPLGQLAMHIAALLSRIVKMSDVDSFDLTAKIDRDPIPTGIVELLAAFEQSERDVERTFAETSEER